MRWVEERQTTAAYFAAKPDSYPFASTTFTQQSEQDIPEDRAKPHYTRLAKLESEHRQMAVLSPGFQTLAVENPPMPPDGVVMRAEIVRWFAPQLRFTPAKEEWALVEKDVSPWHLEHKVANARVREVNGKVRAATYRITDTYEERGVYTFDREYYLQFGSDGQLTTIYSRWESEGDGCDVNRTSRVWDVGRNSKGQVNELVVHTRSDCIGAWDTDEEREETHTRLEKTVFRPIES